MDGMSLFFMDVWTFVFSQVGLVALGAIGAVGAMLFFARWVRGKALTLLGVADPVAPVEMPAQPGEPAA